HVGDRRSAGRARWWPTMEIRARHMIVGHIGCDGVIVQIDGGGVGKGPEYLPVRDTGLPTPETLFPLGGGLALADDEGIPGNNRAIRAGVNPENHCAPRHATTRAAIADRLERDSAGDCWNGINTAEGAALDRALQRDAGD